VWSSTQDRYTSYDHVVEEWEKFSQSVQRNQYLLSLIGRQLRRWRCKLRLGDAERTEEVKTRIDLSTWLMKPVDDPNILVLHNPQKAQELVAVDALPPNLVIGPDDQWAMDQPTNRLEIVFAFFRSFPPVLGTYGSAAIGYSFHNKGMFNDAALAIPPLLGAAIVLLFTLTHAVAPVFLSQILETTKQHLKSTHRVHFQTRTSWDRVDSRVCFWLYLFTHGILVWDTNSFIRFHDWRAQPSVGSGAHHFCQTSYAYVVVSGIWIDFDGVTVICHLFFCEPAFSIRDRGIVVSITAADST